MLWDEKLEKTCNIGLPMLFLWDFGVFSAYRCHNMCVIVNIVLAWRDYESRIRKSLVICGSFICLQVSDYASRKSESLSVIERWLSPVLAYEPA